MIANITTGKSAYGILNYNQLKVDKGKASVLSTRLIFEDPDGKYNVSKMAEEFHNSMPECIRTEKPIVHISLNPDPKDEIDDELLITMAEEYLDGMGWGNQPHIIYKHTDIERVHIHIVTTQVVVFQKVCLGRCLQILQICKYSDSWFRTTRRGVLFLFLCYSLHSGNNSRSRSIRGTGLR